MGKWTINGAVTEAKQQGKSPGGPSKAPSGGRGKSVGYATLPQPSKKRPPQKL